MSNIYDIVRVMRVIEYVGPRHLVEAQVSRSVHGTKDFGNGVRLSAATIGTYPEILQLGLPAPTKDEA